MCKKCEEIERRLKEALEKNKELDFMQKNYKVLKNNCSVLKSEHEMAMSLIELKQEQEGHDAEEIILLKNQLYVKGEKLKIPKKPHLDWNRKILFVCKYVPDFLYKEHIEGIEKLFQDHCLSRWEGAQKVYPKGRPSNVIAFPTLEGGDQ